MPGWGHWREFWGSIESDTWGERGFRTAAGQVKGKENVGKVYGHRQESGVLSVFFRRYTDDRNCFNFQGTRLCFSKCDAQLDHVSPGIYLGFKWM